MSFTVFKKLTYGLNLKTNKMTGGPRPLGYFTNQETSDLAVNPNKRKMENDEADDANSKKMKIDISRGTRSKRHLTLEKIVQMNKEKVAHIRNENRIHVYGSDVPDPIESFEQLMYHYKMPKYFIENIKGMGMNEPSPVQMQAMTAILENRSVMACAPTGSGKTLAFSLPLLHCLVSHQQGGFRAVVLAPTRELAMQIQHEMLQVVKGSTLEIQFLMKSTTTDQRQTWMNADVLITTPKKLIYACKEFKEEISFRNVQYLVVDESDKLFEDGKSGFRDQLAVIYKKCQSSSIKTLFFSATFSPEIEQWCDSNLHNMLKIYIGAKNSAAKTIDQKLIYAGCESGKLLALRNIFTEGFSAPVLIFTQSKQRSEELYNELSEDNMNVEAIHSEKSVAQRDAIIKNFQMGEIWILICTDVMARGIDFKQVNLVINFDFPTSPISYIHRIGRTGRAGKPGKAITLFTDNDVTYLRSIVNLMKEAGCEVPEYMLHIKKAPKIVMKEMSKSAPEREPISYYGAQAYKEKMKKNKSRRKQKTKMTEERND